MAEASAFPAELRRRFEVRLLPVPDMPVRSLREVRARDIGHLVRIRAMVIRASDVKPLAKVITYTCDECGYEIYQEVTSKQFMPLGQCPSPVCKDNKLDGTLHMQTRGSKFVRYQELRVQELPDQVPVGHIPRTVTLVARGQLARELQPGDVASLAVIYTPTPYTGFRAMRAGLTGEPSRCRCRCRCRCGLARLSRRQARRDCKRLARALHSQRATAAPPPPLLPA